MHQRIHTNIYMYNMYKFWFLNMLQVKVDILLFKVRKDLSLIRTDLFIHVTVFVKLSNNNDQNMKHFYIFYYHNRKKQEHIHKHFSKLILCAFFPQNLLFSRSYMASLACLFVGSAQKKKKPELWDDRRVKKDERLEHVFQHVWVFLETRIIRSTEEVDGMKADVSQPEATARDEA